MQFHFRIQIADIKKPPVWREITVPAETNFDKFHHILQAAFGWQNAHLYFFSKAGFVSTTQIKLPDPYDEEEDIRVLHARKTKLKDIFPGTQTFIYTYDFGDSWHHKIKLLKISSGGAKHAIVTAGKGACPPEDCGGPWGYEDLKSTLADPKHPEYAGLREWIGLNDGQRFDATAFDLEAAQEAVRSIR